MIRILQKLIYEMEVKCTEVTLTADEYKNIARELFRPVGRSFIPCPLEEANSMLWSTRNFPKESNMRIKVCKLVIKVLLRETTGF